MDDECRKCIEHRANEQIDLVDRQHKALWLCSFIAASVVYFLTEGIGLIHFFKTAEPFTFLRLLSLVGYEVFALIVVAIAAAIVTVVITVAVEMLSQKENSTFIIVPIIISVIMLIAGLLA